MKPDRSFPSRAACGRADLVRAFAGGEAALAAMAGLLDYEKIADSDKSTDQTEIVIDDVFPTPLLTEPELRLQPLIEIPFWRLVAVDYREKEDGQSIEGVEEEGGSIELPDWRQDPKVQPLPRELVAWRDLVPRLRRAMTEWFDTRTPNIPVIVDRLSRGHSLERLPHRTHRRWGQSVTVIEDRSDRLIPYWRDQSRVRTRLARLFPRHAFEHLLFWEGLTTPVPADCGIDRRADWLPSPGDLVVVLGDLGLLARDGWNIRRHWADLGRRLTAARCRTLALTPTAPKFYPAELIRYWQPLSWDRETGLAPGAARHDAAVERLLTLLSPASRIEPGLLREVRLRAGYDAATESVFWQHSALASDSSVAATLDAQTVRERRTSFCNEPEAVQAEVLKTIRRWRGGLSPEVWYAEIQGLERELRGRLIDPEEVRQSQAFFAILGRRLRGVGGSAAPEGLAAWFRFVESRLPEDYRQDQELGEHFEQLWRLAHAHESQSVSVPQYDPARFPTSGPPRRVVGWQQGDSLCFALAPDHVESHTSGSPVAGFETRNGEIQVEPLLANSDHDPSFWRSGQPPSWADTWGTDGYGHWVTFSVTNKQGQKITQRMRWIEPGTFKMGSPEDEPGRWDAEGPQHSVAISRGFWLFDTACTQALWEAVMGDNPSGFKGADRPVESVSWNGCQDFIKRLNERLPGLDLALPSEAQWEYTCRAGTTTPFSFGDNITPEQVNYNGNYPYAGGKKGRYRQETVPVASLPPNPWGLYEMHGNVWEWCQDHWHDSYRGAQANGSAWEGRDAGASRIVRGGSWSRSARGVRSAVRYARRPVNRDGDIGFRCARVRVASPDSLEGAEPAGPARGRQAERWPKQDQPSGATGAQPTLLRLNVGESPAHCPLPQTPAFHIHTDREHLVFGRFSLRDCPWASAIGRDRFGLWCEIAVEPTRGGEPVVQRLRWIPPGRFWMGSPKEETRGLAKQEYEREWFDAEHPRHLVTLTEGYWLFDTPCTQALWEAVMEENPSRFQSPTQPVEQVSWHDAQDFLKRLNGRISDLNLALPSEAQWEYACRAGTTTPFSFGANITPEQANYDGNYPYAGSQKGQYRQQTVPVASLPPNPWGLYEMHGNVWEWTQDHWHANYEGAPTDGSAWLSSDAGADRVLRGGSWDDSARSVRAACRGVVPPVDRDDFIGFRCARVRVASPASQSAGKSDAPGAGVAPSGAPGRQGDGSRSERPARGGRSTKTKRSK
ncbi:MAG: formylglycine-generating enzyme family protein [Candidatus Competibacteraceae bacterium]